MEVKLPTGHSIVGGTVHFPFSSGRCHRYLLAMPKRKRSSSAEAASADEAMTSPPPAPAVAPATRAPDGAKQQRVQHKLKQGVVKIGHAFKLAKGFERQKLGRRQKSAGAERKEQDIRRINAEIAALKVRMLLRFRAQLYQVADKRRDRRHSTQPPQVAIICTRRSLR